MPHVVLLGDSIFDNAAYVAGGPAVIDQLRECLPSGWKATLLAVDGSVTIHILRQLKQLPILDLRLICNSPNDYANEIEPSVTGGAKIATAITRAITTHDFALRRSSVFI